MDWWMDLGAGVIGGIIGAGIWLIIVVVHGKIENYRDRKWLREHALDEYDNDD